MADFKSLWAAACKEDSPDPNGAAGKLMAAIAELLDADQVEYGKVGNAALFLFDLSRLGFRGMDLNVVMITHPPDDEEETAEHVRLLADYKQAVKSVGFCLYIVLSEELALPNGSLPSSLDAVLLSGDDLKRLFSSRVPNSVVFTVISRQVSMHRLCPFNTTHEARGAMFRGRTNELSRLVEDMGTHFVVTGARRIGKTSLLMRAYDALRVRQDLQDRVFYFNCLTWGDDFDCFNRIAHQVDRKREFRIGRHRRNVSYMLERRSHHGHRPLIFFLDETDRIVDVDASREWPLFNVLAEAAKSRWIRLTLAGYRSMTRLTVGRDAPTRKTVRRIDTPFHGALDLLTLTPLSAKDTRALVAESFASIEVPIQERDKVCSRIWQSTNGYPFVVQFYGEELYQRATQRKSQKVLLKDVDEIEEGFALSHFLETHFLENTLEFERPARVERMCAVLYAHSGNGERWAEGDFLKACMDVGLSAGMDEIHSALENLHNAYILTYKAGQYTFSLPLLRRILADAFPDPGVMLKSLERE